MRVGTGAENSGDHELGLRKFVSKHRHEGMVPPSEIEQAGC